jgi:hypothetical protein
METVQITQCIEPRRHVSCNRICCLATLRIKLPLSPINLPPGSKAGGINKRVTCGVRSVKLVQVAFVPRSSHALAGSEQILFRKVAVVRELKLKFTALMAVVTR